MKKITQKILIMMPIKSNINSTNKLFSKVIIMLLLSIVINKVSFAQPGVIDNTVVVVAAYEPTISDAYKITFNPTMKDTVFETPKLSYGIESNSINTSITLDPIKAAKVVGEPVTKLYKNLIEAGFGNYTTPYFELFANSTRSKTDAFGAHIKYLSSTSSIKDYTSSDYSDLNMEVYGNKYLKKSTLDGEVFFSRDALNYYGYDHNDAALSNSIKDTKQRYALIGLNTSYYSNYVDSNSLDYKLTLGYSNLSDFYKSSENNVKLGLDVDQNLKLFKLANRQAIGLKADLDYYNNSTAGTTANTALVKLQPFVSAHLNEYMLYAGLSVNFVTGTESKLYIYPVIEGSLAVIPKVLKVFAGIKGEVTRNSFKSLSDENPYIETNTPLGYANNKFEFYGGVHTSLTKTIDFTARLSTKSIDGFPLFVNDTNTGNTNKFTVVYDNITVFNINSEIQWRTSEKVTLLAVANWNQYSTNQIEAWHRPTLDAKFSVYYNISNKIITHLDIFAFDKMYARTFNKGVAEASTINGMVDFNMGIEYRINKIFSAFVNLNNFGTTQYYNFYNYPTQRFNMLAGLTYAF